MLNANLSDVLFLPVLAVVHKSVSFPASVKAVVLRHA